MGSQGHLPVRDRLDVAAAGIGERLSRWRSLSGRRVTLAVVLPLVLVTAGATVEAGVLVGSPRPTTAGHVTTSGPASGTTFEGSCTTSGTCMLTSPRAGACHTVVTLNAATGAVVASRLTCRPAPRPEHAP